MNSKPCILIADDDADVRNLIKAMLSQDKLQYEFLFAENGDEALSVAKQSSPDLILLDVVMPGCDGLAVCRQLRADPRLSEIPIIILTAMDDRQSMIDGIEAGADEFVTKPCDKHELQLRVKGIIRTDRFRRMLSQKAKIDWMIDSSDEGYVVLKRDGAIQFCNAKAYSYLGLPSGGDDICGKNFLEVARRRYSLEPAEAWSNWPAPVAPGVKRFLIYPETHTSKAFWLQAEVPAIEDPSEETVIRLRDVTKQASLFRNMQTFHILVSHKLRTPINQILLSTQLMESAENDKRDELIKMAFNGAERLRDEVEGVLRFLRTEDKSAVGEPFATEHLHQLVSSVAAAMPGVVQLELESTVSSRVPISQKALFVVLREIFMNSIKFHPAGTPKISVTSSRSADNFTLRVTDDGLTLSPEQISIAFLPYTQGEKFFTGQVGGMGVGLALVSNLIWEVGGTCRLFNRPDATGVTVELVLPVLKDGQDVSDQQSKPPFRVFDK